MSRPTNKPPVPEKSDFPRRKSGRASFDADGRGIWEWQTATGVFERNVTEEQVAKLEDTTLSIVEDAQSTGTHIYAPATHATPVKSAPRKAPVKSTEPSTVLSRLLKRFGKH
jgi:hypothetical protein